METLWQYRRNLGPKAGNAQVLILTPEEEIDTNERLRPTLHEMGLIAVHKKLIVCPPRSVSLVKFTLNIAKARMEMVDPPMATILTDLQETDGQAALTVPAIAFGHSGSYDEERTDFAIGSIMHAIPRSRF